MPRFAANLTFLWPELPVLDRFAAAAHAGFGQVEILFVHDLDGGAVERALREHALSLCLFDPRSGDWGQGERGLLTLPGREAEFLESIREGIANARRFGTPRLNALAGIPPSGVSREEALAVAAANFRAAVPLIEAAGLELLIENINGIDMPGYFAETPAQAAELVALSGSSRVKLQLDQYHCGMMGIDACAALREHAGKVAHVQIADVPGRHQPGTGAQLIGDLLQLLDSSGYAGSVGLEYKPLGPTEASLEWLPRPARA